MGSLNAHSHKRTIKLGEHAHRIGGMTSNQSTDIQAPSPEAEELFNALGAAITPDLFIEALTHRSFTNEHPGARNYERLEFLGDAVLELVATETLYKMHPDYSEGQMSRIRSKAVSEESLSEIARDKLHASQFILLGIGEQRDNGADKDSILCDIVEALIGAVFVEYGIEKAREVVHNLIDDNLSYYSHRGPALDWKTAIVVKAHEMDLGEVSYQMEMRGPENKLEFTAHLFIENPAGIAKDTGEKDESPAAGSSRSSENTGFGQRRELAVGHGSSKRKAQLDAAEKAWRILDTR